MFIANPNEKLSTKPQQSDILLVLRFVSPFQGFSENRAVVIFYKLVTPLGFIFIVFAKGLK